MEEVIQRAKKLWGGSAAKRKVTYLNRGTAEDTLFGCPRAITLATATVTRSTWRKVKL